MGNTYTRQSSYTDGDVIQASNTNNEFDQLVSAFNESTGHTHDGTSAEGGPVTKLLGTSLTFGDATSGTDITVTFDGESNDGVLKWMEDEDYFEFSDDILIATTEKLQFRDTAIYINSSADGQLDLVADTEIQIAATTVDINGLVDISGNLTVGGNLSVAGTTSFSGGTLNLGDGAGDSVVFGADVNSSIIPNTDSAFDLGSASQEWRDLFLDGTANIDTASIDNISDDTLVATNKKIQFRDTAISVSSSADATLDIVSDGAINLTAGTDVVIPANVGITFGTGEKIEGDSTDLTVTSGADINLTATADVNIPSGVGLTFGDDGEKIEGDGTDLTISGNNINLTAVADIVVPANVGLTFGTGEKIEGDSTDLTVTSGAKINLTATSDVHIPNDVGIVFGGASEKIEGDGTDLTISGAKINLNATTDVHLANNIGVVFGDAGEKIEGDGTNLAINSSGDVNITATIVDLDGNLEVSGTTAQVGILTTTATQVATGGITSGSNIVSDTDSTDDLGTTSVRWANLFVDGITATDQITATGFTGTLDGILGSGAAATASVTTLDTSGAVNLNLTTDSTSSTSGALIVDGGVGVAKKLFVGTDLDVDGTTNLDVTNIVGNLTVDSDTVTIQSANTTDPVLIIKQKTSDGTSSRLHFVKDGGRNGANGDDLAEIDFIGDDAGQNQTTFGRIEALIASAADGSEGGKIRMRVATHDGEMQTGFEIIDGSAEDEIDVNIGQGTDSITSVAGVLNVGHDFDVTGDAVIDGTALVTGVLTTTAATVFNGGFASNGNSTVDGTFIPSGKITADAGIDIDNFNIDGTTIALSSGNMTLDVAGSISLDADNSGIILLKDDGDIYGQFFQSSSDFFIQSQTSDKDMIFRGNDNGNVFTALTLDMSDAGSAIFNSAIFLNADLIHTGDTDTQFQFSNANEMRLIAGNVETFKTTATEVSVNDQSANVDFRVESNGNANMLFVDGGADHVNIGTASDFGGTLNVFKTGGSAAVLNLVNDDGSGNAGPFLTIDRRSGSPANGDLGGVLQFQGNNDAANTMMATISARFDDISNGTENTSMFFKTRQAGGQPNVLIFDPVETVVNEDSFNRDFRVESNGNSNAFIVDAGSNVALFGTSAVAGITANTFPVIAGGFTTHNGVTASNTSTATTLMAFGSNEGNFLVSARLSGTGDSRDNTTGIVHVNNTAATYTVLAAGSRLVLSLSGLNLQVTQTVFNGANTTWNIIRVSR